MSDPNVPPPYQPDPAWSPPPGAAYPPPAPYPQVGYGQLPPYGPPPTPKPLSITGMVLGIVGVVLCLFYGIGLLPAIAGIIVSAIARRREPHGKPFWLTGLITSIAGTVISALVVIAVVLFVVFVVSHPSDFNS